MINCCRRGATFWIAPFIILVGVAYYFFTTAITAVGEDAQGIGYNYEHMISLMEQHRELSIQYYTAFEAFKKNKKKVLPLVLQILDRLHAEQDSFSRFIQQIKTEYKGSLSKKKEESLRFYLRSLHSAIHDFELMKKALLCSQGKTPFVYYPIRTILLSSYLS